MAGKTILILGGGVGGLVAANELRRRLDREHRIVLVDKAAKHAFAPSFLWLMLGWRQPWQLCRDLNILKRKGIEVVQAEVTRIDVAGRGVRTAAGEISYDHVVIALGAELAPQMIPGFSEGAHSVYDLKSAERFRDALAGFRGGTVAVVISSLPFKCPAAPYEAALLMEYAFRRRGLRQQVDLHVFTPEALPMPVAGPAVGAALKEMIEARGITFVPKVKLASVNPETKELAFEGGRTARYDLLCGVPPHRSPAVVAEAGLTDATGWIPVNGKTLETRHERVYALGDVTAIKLPGGLMLPKAGVFAHHQAEVVVRNIGNEILGRGPKAAFDGSGY